MKQAWGYRANGAAKIFDLEDGDSLPDGWFDSPTCIEDEDKRNAEALSQSLRDTLDAGVMKDVEPTVAVGEVRKRRGRPPKVADPAPEVGSEA